MIPRIGSRGMSFKGAALYYLHDKDAMTAERVAWTRTENLGTDDPDIAIGWMISTAKDAPHLKRQAGIGRASVTTDKPVWTLSLSWHPEQRPDREHMEASMKAALATLGLEKHQALLIEHNDEAHPHVHAIVNLIHPETGMVAPLKFSKEKLSKWAESYEREHGRIYCEQRVENNEKRRAAELEKAGEYPRYKDPEIELKALITRLYHQADSGKAFAAALSEHGFSLAQGKRIVLLAPDGSMHSVSRQIEGVKAKDIRAKLADLELPDVEEARERQERESAGNRERRQGGPDERQAEPEASATTEAPAKGKEQGGPDERQAEPEASATTEAPAKGKEQAGPIIIDRDRQAQDWQDKLEQAAIAYAETEKRTAELERRQAGQERIAAAKINQAQARHHAELARHYSSNQKAREKLETTLEAQHGSRERRLRQDIAALQSALRNSGFGRRLWWTITGQLERCRQEIEGKRLSLQNIEWRKLEARDALDKELKQRGTVIRERQAAERNEIERQYPARHRGPDAFDKILEREMRAIEQRELDRERNPGRQRDGPELEL